MVRFTAFVVSLVIFVTPLAADAQGRGRGRGVERLTAVSPPGRAYDEPAFARGYSDGFKHAQEDRRKVFVRPTPEGCALVASVRSDMVENLMRMMSHLDLGEQKAWVRIYEKIFDFCQNP